MGEKKRLINTSGQGRGKRFDLLDVQHAEVTDAMDTRADVN